MKRREHDMKMVKLRIDGQVLQVEEGKTILEAAKSCGIDIPTLCHSDKLEPYGACRLCMVEITKGERTRLVASCVYEVEDDLIVRTDTEQVKKIRRMIIELLWPSLTNLAEEYGVTASRFWPEETECNLCGLCVRYCSEIKKLDAVYFKGKGIDREIAIVPELAKECAFCHECHELCTGGWIVTHSDQIFG